MSHHSVSHSVIGSGNVFRGNVTFGNKPEPKKRTRENPYTDEQKLVAFRILMLCKELREIIPYVPVEHTRYTRKLIELYFPNKTISQIEDNYQIALQERKVPGKHYTPSDVAAFDCIISTYGRVGLFSKVDSEGVAYFYTDYAATKVGTLEAFKQLIEELEESLVDYD